MIGALASVLQLGYTLFLICVGAFGMFFLHWEISTFYGLADVDLQGIDGATLLNQFRFLKAIELAFGLFCLIYRRDILSGGLACTICLVGLGLGVFARACSWMFDGTPHTSFIWYLVIEAVIFCMIWLNARRVMAER
ncbi:MAG: DUF4345 family protein [Yoonia sp.]|uniref:DUF4345 family protein n=1 Tax=Yoonia sp. TaxID=2212373 RepID=UPI003EF1E3BD